MKDILKWYCKYERTETMIDKFNLCDLESVNEFLTNSGEYEHVGPKVVSDVGQAYLKIKEILMCARRYDLESFIRENKKI